VADSIEVGSELPRLVLEHGYEGARDLLLEAGRKSDIPFLGIAQSMLSDDRGEVGISYSGLCLTSLPHKKLPDDQSWKRTGYKVTLLVQPGTLMHKGKEIRYGVPYGARARMILIYLMSEAYRTNSREIRLGGSLRGWFERMGISFGGETAKAIRDQAARINACSLRFFWETDNGADAFAKGGIVSSGLMFRADSMQRGRAPAQGRLFDDLVVLDEVFWKALQDHHVPLREEAVKQLRDRSLALDVYIWLCYRMRSIEKPTSITWAALFDQFGSGFGERKHFKKPFRDALKAASAAYPEARIALQDKMGVVLEPSPSPVSRAMVNEHRFQILQGSRVA